MIINYFTVYPIKSKYLDIWRCLIILTTCDITELLYKYTIFTYETTADNSI